MERISRFSHKIGIGLLACFFFLQGVCPLWANPDNEIPANGMVTLVDLGATTCIPCKMMAPILNKLEKDYRGKVAIFFIDVWKTRDQADRFGIRAIPTQIFYDKKGQEVFRHEGFMSEKDIIFQFKKMGVN